MSAAVQPRIAGATEVTLGRYRITVAPHLLDMLGALVQARCPAHRYAVITDESVASLHGERALATFATPPTLHVIPAGEQHKTRESWARLTDELLAAGHGRDSAVVALGGGVVGDLAGFVAATFMRGIRYVQVPTTFLAMVDASIGGKTGVDTAAGKNLVGAFHQPEAVLADPEALRTLPDAHLRAGVAEAIKHGVIADEAYFGLLAVRAPALLRATADWSDEQAREWASIVVRSVEIKSTVVERDEREGSVRKTLNFGHTLGHAIELLSGFTMLHGEAIAIGMLLEAELGERLGVTENGTRSTIESALRAIELPIERPRDQRAADILAATRLDKKARGGAVEYALPLAIGSMAAAEHGYGVRVPDELVLEVLG